MVRIFGEVRVEGCGGELTLSSAKKLLVLLIVRPKKVWQRDQICRIIWPTESPEVTRNRLRTALVQLKKVLGDAVEWGGGKHDLSLHWNDAQIDFEEATNLKIKLGLTVDEAESEAMIGELLKIIDQPLASDLPDFAIEKRAEWIAYRTDSLLTLADVHQSRGQLQEAIALTERALEHAPKSEKIWRSLLLLHAKSGDHVNVCKRFAAAKADLWRESNTRFSQELVHLADNVRRQRNLVPAHGPMIGMLAGKTLARMLDESPNRAISFLGCPEFKVEVFDHPKEALEVLTRALDATTGAHPDRMQCAVYAMIAGTVSEITARIEDFGKQVLNGDTDPARLRAAATMLANIYFNQGDTESYIRMWQVALQYAEEAGNPVGIEVLMIQKALFHWQAGQDVTAIYQGAKHAEALAEYDEHNAHSGRAVFLTYMATALACERRFEEAVSAFSDAVIEARRASHSEILMLCDAPLGLCRIGLGEVDEGLQILGSGVAERFRTGSHLTSLWGLLFAAIAFDLLGEPESSKALLIGIESLAQQSKCDPLFLSVVRDQLARFDGTHDGMGDFDAKNLKTLTNSTMREIARLRQRSFRIFSA